MLHKAISNLKNQDGEGEGGFTLIELLVVILIIGILAAIALPTFLGQSDKAKDSSAKSDARNLVTMVESCYSTTNDYATCVTPTQLGSPNGLNMSATATATPAKGEVSVIAGGATDPYSYRIVAASQAKTNTFSISKDKTTGTAARTCTGSDGCNAGSW